MRFIFAASTERAWIWTNVVAPFAITRLALLLAGWFSQYFPASLNYPPEEVARRGWQFSPHRLLDIWGRWDTAWYLSIVSDGYSIRGDVETTLSNIAFFPFYPYLVKLL
ncbi:MAG TPA: hypothetical protein VER55_11165, partial [Ardenticatenaceae bacterium]|nr:hypothetical protein [Ardenticatenaceae bacterium]